jgi:hypothetical protein
MPTIGQLKFFVADCDDLVPLVFTREEEALDFAFRFAAMGRFYVSLRLRITQAAIKNGARVRAKSKSSARSVNLPAFRIRSVFSQTSRHGRDCGHAFFH